MPIIVPKGKYCWMYTAWVDKHGGIICEHFDNEGGHPYCELLDGSLRTNKYGVLKCQKCLSFKEKI